MRTLSARALQAALARETGEVFLCALMINHPSLSTPVLIVNDTQVVTRTDSISRTNLVYPSNPTSAWGNTNSTVTPNAATAPDGTTTATSVMETAVTGGHYIGPRAWSVQPNTTYVISHYVKPVNNRYCAMSFTDNGGANWGSPAVDLVSGTVTNAGTNGLVVTITPDANGYFRVTQTLTTSATATTLTLRFGTSANGSFAPTYTGNPANGMYVWGIQMEATTLPAAPLIPTTTGPVTATVSMPLPYQPFAFQVALPEEVEDQVPQVTVTFDNIDLSILTAIRTLTGVRPTVTFVVILAATPNTVEAGPFNFVLTQVQYDSFTIQGTLSYQDDILNQSFPTQQYTPINSPGLYK